MKEKLVFALVACVLAVVAGAVAKFAPEAVGPVAIPLVGVVVVIAAYLKPPSGGAPPSPPALLVFALALSVSACSLLRPSSPLDFAKAACVAANAFLDVKGLRVACDGLEGVTDADLEKLMAASRAGAQKAGAAVCKDAGAE